jgi:hypothetical protein
LKLNRLGRTTVAAAGLLVVMAATLPAAQADGSSDARPHSTGVWQEVSLGQTPPTQHYVDRIVPTSSGDVLATTDGQDVRCWNGTGWQIVAKPPIADDDPQYAGMGGVSCSDFYIYDALDEPGRWHWNGTSWQHAPTGNKYPTYSFTVFAANDMWELDNTPRHFDGTAWRTVTIPSALAGGGAIGSSGHDMWIIGWSAADIEVELTFHWDGSKWKEFPLPSSWKSYTTGPTVYVSPNDIYLFADTTSGGYLHWDGTSWRPGSIGITMPKSLGYVQDAAYADGTVWLSVYDHILRLDAGVWTESPLPVVTNPGPFYVKSMAADPRTGLLVAGGSAGVEYGSRPALLTHQG